jgi:hypothetical protein
MVVDVSFLRIFFRRYRVLTTRRRSSESLHRHVSNFRLFPRNWRTQITPPSKRKELVLGSQYLDLIPMENSKITISAPAENTVKRNFDLRIVGTANRIIALAYDSASLFGKNVGGAPTMPGCPGGTGSAVRVAFHTKRNRVAVSVTDLPVKKHARSATVILTLEPEYGDNSPCSVASVDAVCLRGV